MAESKSQNPESMNESFISARAESEKTDDDYEVVRQSSAGSDSSPSESGASNDQTSVKDGEQTNKAGIKDLGWNRDAKDISPCMIPDVPNDIVWTLIRRFNKQVYHVKTIQGKPPGNLDLNVAEEEEFSPDKLRSNIERLYMTVLVGMWKFIKHMALLRSWNQKLRTSVFCIIYYTAWAYNILLPVLLAFLAMLVLSPQFRTLAFPEIPMAIINPLSGDLQKPKAGMLGSVNSMTGAPEQYPGEAVEREASDFVSGIATIGLSSSLGKQPKETEGAVAVVGEDGTTTLPDSSEMAAELADAKADAQGAGEVSHDGSKRFVEDAMWQKMRPMMHILGDFCDTWERMGNALTPTYPFGNAAQLRLVLVLSTCALSSFFVKSHLVIKTSTFLAGVLFFNQPFIFRMITLFNENFPNWPELVELRSTLLKDVPTNTQLAASLLRIGEERNAPLVPPPSNSIADSDASPNVVDINTLSDSPEGIAAALNTTTEELQDTIAPNETPNLDNNTTSPTMTRMLALQLVGVAKLAAKAGTSVVLGADNLKAHTGSEESKQRVGVIPTKKSGQCGPMNFTGRYHGKEGVLSIISDGKSKDDARVTFSFTGATAPAEAAGRQQARKMFGVDEDKEDLSTKDVAEGEESKGAQIPGYGLHGEANAAAFSVRVGDICEIKKVGGLSWQGKLIVGWALDRNVADAVAIVDKQGKEWLVTAIEGSNEVFNRLLSMGSQKWESW